MRMILMKINKRLTIELVVFSLLAVLGISLVISATKLKLIPPLNNFFLIFSYILFLSVFIFLIYKLFKANLKNLKSFVKPILIVLSILAFSFFSFYYFLVTVFSYMDYQSFKYSNQKYYVLKDGFPDIIYSVYQSQGNGKMKEVQVYYDHKNFPDEINDSNKEAIATGKLNELIAKQKSTDLSKSEKEKSQKKLEDLYKSENAKKIPNSDYEVVAIDKAAARNRYFFIENSNGKKVLLAELPATANYERGSVTPTGDIYLYFRDVNGKISTYLSQDNGKSWNLIN